MYENAMKDVPAVLRTGSDEYETHSAYWAFRANSTLAQTNMAKYAPVMAAWQHKLETTFSQQQSALDSMLQGLYQQNPQAAIGFANQWSNGNMLWAVQSARDVNQSLMTDMEVDNFSHRACFFI